MLTVTRYTVYSAYSVSNKDFQNDTLQIIKRINKINEDFKEVQGVPPRGLFGSLSIQHWRTADPPTPYTISYYFIIFTLSFNLLVLCNIFFVITKDICLHI